MNELNNFINLFPNVSTGFVFLLGAIIGSFLNVFVYRYPLIFKRENLQAIKDYFDELEWPAHQQIEEELNKPKLTLSTPRSHCPKCNTAIKWYHNIPIISYLLLKGRCAYCQEKYSSSYMLVELFTGLILAGSFYYFKDNLLWPIILIIVLITLAMTLIDIKALIIPDELNYFLLWTIVALAAFNYHPFGHSLKETILGAIAGYLIIYFVGLFAKLILKRDGIGQGDYKLIAALGALVGIKGAIFTFFFSPFIGIAFWLITSLMKLLDNNKVEKVLPYGPSLILACWVYIFYGEKMLKSIGLIF